MAGPAPDSTPRETLAAALRLLGVPTDDARLAELERRAAALLEDGDHLSARAAPEVEPMVALRLSGAEREEGRSDG